MSTIRAIFVSVVALSVAMLPVSVGMAGDRFATGVCHVHARRLLPARDALRQARTGRLRVVRRMCA